jgi:DNA-binding CsgD family transcriptional regulator
MAGGFPSAAFIGREAELRRLEAVLDRAAQGRPQLVLLPGDAGVGKTRLLLALAGRARQAGTRVLAGGCVELGDIGLPYLPVVDALRQLADDPEVAGLLADVAMTAPGLGRLLPGIDRAGALGGSSDGADQLQLLDAVRAILVGLAQRSSVLLVLEDLHWADRATRDLVSYLARTLRSGRVTLAVSYRSDELDRGHPLRPLLAELARLPGVERLPLTGFGRVELAQHLEAISGAPLPADQVEAIHARSEGNPFYAEQLLAAGAGDTRAELPATLADVLLARVHRLSEPSRLVLRVAAVAGRRVPHELLAEVAGQAETELERSLHEAVGAGVLVTNPAAGGYAFHHALLQEAVYGDLLPGERVRLHTLYARRLAAESGGPAAELAYHCLASHDLAGALAASVRAAGEALAVLAPAEALRHLQGALELWERVPEPAATAGTDQVELKLWAAAAASAAGELHAAVRLAREAADATEDPAQGARANERLGSYLFDAGRIEDALAARARAVELVPSRPPTRLRARVTASMAQVLVNIRRRDEARRWCEQALVAAREAGSADDEADVLITLGMVEQFDDPAGACARFAAARAQAAAAGSPEIELRALYDLAQVTNELGDLPSARAAFDEGAVLAERTGHGWSRFGILMRRRQLLLGYLAGDWDGCEQLIAAGPELVTTLATAEVVAEGLGVLVARASPAAPERLRQLRQLAGTNPDLDKNVAVWEAELSTWQGRLDRAREAIGRGLAAADAIEHFDQALEGIWVCTTGIAVEADRAERARAAGNSAALTGALAAGDSLVERARAGLEQAPLAGLGHDVHVRGRHARAEAEWARLRGRSDPARWQAAVDAFSYGNVYEEARCRWRLAEALAGTGQRERAAAEARDAHATASRLGAAQLRTALEALARRARLDLGRGARPQRTPAGLTPRELEVLGLLVEGRSNRQIAEQLFISGKTAGVHVTNLLAKLGVHSRLEAAAMARQLGLDRSAGPGR